MRQTSKEILGSTEICFDDACGAPVVDASCVGSYVYHADAYVERKDFAVGFETFFGKAKVSSAEIVQSRCSEVEFDAEVTKFTAETSEVVPKFVKGR